MSLVVRPAAEADAFAIAAIHGEGIADRVATFRTEAPAPAEVEGWLGSGRPFLVADRDGVVVGWAGCGPYDDPAPFYRGVGEAAVYVGRGARGTGVGRALLERLEEVAADARFHKLIAKVFDTNETSLRLFERGGWRIVGIHRRHGRLDGEWKDVIVLERLLGEAAG